MPGGRDFQREELYGDGDEDYPGIFEVGLEGG